MNLNLLAVTKARRRKECVHALKSACTHSLFFRAREPVCAISLGARDLSLRLANKRTASLPENGELEYRQTNNLFEMSQFLT